MYQPATRSLISGSGPSVVTGAASGRLRVDVLAVLLEQLADVLEEAHVRLHVLGGPLVHRGHGTVRLRAAAVVLEEQVLRHGGLLVVVGRACRGPSPGERSRSELLDMESLI